MAPKLLQIRFSQEQVSFLRVSGLKRKKRELSHTLQGFLGETVGAAGVAAGGGTGGFISCWIVTVAAWSYLANLSLSCRR